MMKRLVSAAALVAALALAAAPAAAGSLRLLVQGGPESALSGGFDPGQSDLPLTRPADLLDSTRPQFTLSREYENTYYERKGETVTQLANARSKKAELFVPLNERPRYRTVYAGDRFQSYNKYLNAATVADTRLYITGKGGVNAVAQQIGRLRLGYYDALSRETISGTSAEAVDRIEYLDASARVLGFATLHSEGAHASFDISPRIRAGYLKASETARGQIRFADAADEFKLPISLSGERREVSLRLRPSPRWQVRAVFRHGGYESFDYIHYNTTAEIGRWLSSAEFTGKSLTLTKHSSENKETTFGFEKYDGWFNMAGTLDVPGTSADFLFGYNLYHAYGTLDRTTLSYATRWRKGRNTWRASYSRGTGHLRTHFDGRNGGLAVLLGLTPARSGLDDRAYDLTQHTVGFGLERPVARDTIFQYSFIQTVPLLKEKDVPAPAPAAPGAQPSPSHKVRGGALHLISVKYLF